MVHKEDYIAAVAKQLAPVKTEKRNEESSGLCGCHNGSHTDQPSGMGYRRKPSTVLHQ